MLQESSRVVETFKLISLVDHGLQPTQINMNLMLQTCYKQILNRDLTNNVECPEDLILMASPNAIHQILCHIIRYVSSFSTDFENKKKADAFKILAVHTPEDLQLEFSQIINNTTSPIDETSIETSIEASVDLGLQIIESIVNHYFNGSLNKTNNNNCLTVSVRIPNMFIADSKLEEGGDLNA